MVIISNRYSLIQGTVTVQNIDFTKLGIAAGIVFAAYKFGTPMIKGAAISIAAVIAAKQLPYVKEFV